MRIHRRRSIGVLSTVSRLLNVCLHKRRRRLLDSECFMRKEGKRGRASAQRKAGRSQGRGGPRGGGGPGEGAGPRRDRGGGPDAGARRPGRSGGRTLTLRVKELPRRPPSPPAPRRRRNRHSVLPPRKGSEGEVREGKRRRRALLGPTPSARPASRSQALLPGRPAGARDTATPPRPRAGSFAPRLPQPPEAL